MGCNCGKKRTRPAGMRLPREEQRTKESDNKGDKSGKSGNFTLELPTGKSQTFGSRLAADAARVRLGGQGTVRPT